MFIYKQWDKFCEKLNSEGFVSVTASSVIESNSNKPFLILKHDVETKPYRALKLAQIESKYNHKGSYYVQAYLLHNDRNIDILKQIQKLGHEVSYHHDVMDSNNGNIIEAKKEFKNNIELFEKNGFLIKTVCQHGNPVVERKGYTSNRDFFRDSEVAHMYNRISEIMVNYRSRINIDYNYISDAGYNWKVIYDPENNDIEKSGHLDISLTNLDGVMMAIKSGHSSIVSTHPHRWHRNALTACLKDMSFKIIRSTAKVIVRIPTVKKLMGRYYYLAKKI